MTPPFAISPSGSLHHTSIGGAEFVLPHLGSKTPAGAPSVVVPTRTSGVSAATHGERLPVSDGEES